MRAVFTVEVPAVSIDRFSTNEEFLSRIRSHGWEEMKNRDLSPEERETRYIQQADTLWSSMPEIAAREKEYVIFYGLLQDNQTQFIVTRVVEGQATFRLLQSNLEKLQASTTSVIRRLTTTQGNQPGVKIRYERIAIYEKGDDEIIIEGRVIPNALLEAWKTDKRNILLAVSGLLLTVPSILFLFFIDPAVNRIIGGTLERLSTAFITTTIVSAIGFLQTFLQIRGVKLINWAVASEEHKGQTADLNS